MKLPLGPTVLVAVAVPTMIYAGFWQLQRREEKRIELIAFAHPRTVTLDCEHPIGPVREIGGLGPKNDDGWGHRIECGTGPARTIVDLGWTERPANIAMPAPGPIVGTEFRIPERPPLLLALHPAPPMLPSAPPNIDDIPNSHLSYTIQWFAFALTLSVVYAFYVRRWRKERTEP